MQKKILVTGGAGYIGSHTVIALVEAGFEPIIVDNYCNSEPWILDRLTELTGKQIKNYTCDCSDKQELEKIFNKENLHGVIQGFSNIKENFNFSVFAKHLGQTTTFQLQPRKRLSDTVAVTKVISLRRATS